jgi:hypothetical protein
MKRESSNLIKIIALVFALTAMTGSVAQADVKKGQKIYLKKLKSRCGFTGAKMAGMHTQDEWEEIREDGQLAEEIQKQCPKVKGLKERYLPDLYDFFYEYGSDSGNVPSCG